MSSKTWDYTFIIYVFPEDLSLIRKALAQEKLFPYLYGYDVGLVGFKLSWQILDEEHPQKCCLYNFKPESEGVLAGMYCLRFSWSGPEDASHLIDFKKKYNLGLQQFAITGDWLGEPECLIFSPQTRTRCLKILKNIKLGNV